MWKIGIWAEKFHGRSYFSFAMIRWKLFSWWKNSKFPTFKLYTVPEKMLYHQRYSRDFKKLSFRRKMWKNRYFAQKFHWRSYFSFAMVRWKLLQKENLKFPNSKLHTVREKMLYHQGIDRKNAISPKVFNRLSKTFLLQKDVENRYLSRKFHWRSYFSFSMVRWKLFSGGKIPNFPLSSCTLCQKKGYITKGIQPIFQKLFLCWKMCKIGIWAEHFIGAAILVLQW